MKTPGSTLATVLLTVISLLNFVPTPTGEDGIPVFVARLSLALGVLGLIAAAGLWLGRRWAKGLAVGVALLGGLSAAPGLAFAPNPTLRVLATVGVLASALIVWLLVRAPRGRAVA